MRDFDHLRRPRRGAGRETGRMQRVDEFRRVDKIRRDFRPGSKVMATETAVSDDPGPPSCSTPASSSLSSVVDSVATLSISQRNFSSEMNVAEGLRTSKPDDVVQSKAGNMNASRCDDENESPQEKSAHFKSADLRKATSANT